MGHKFSAASDRIYLQNAANELIFDTNRSMPHIMKEVSFSTNIIFPAESWSGGWTSNVNAKRQTVIIDSSPPQGANFVLIRCDTYTPVSGDGIEGGTLSLILNDGYGFVGSLLTASSEAYQRRIDAVISGGQVQLQAWVTHSTSYVPGKFDVTPLPGPLTFNLAGVAYIGRIS